MFAYVCKAKCRLSISDKTSKLRCTVTDTLDFEASYEKKKNLIFNQNIFDLFGFKNVIKMKTKKGKREPLNVFELGNHTIKDALK